MLRDPKYLKWLRTQRCILTGRRGNEYEAVDPAHIGTAGKGIKSPDNEALPVLHSIHANMMHQHGEITTLREKAPDALLRAAFKALAREMYQEYLREEAT